MTGDFLMGDLDGKKKRRGRKEYFKVLGLNTW